MANLSAYWEYNLREILLTFEGLSISRPPYTLRTAHLRLDLTMARQLPPTGSQSPPPTELALTPTPLTPKPANSAVNQIPYRPCADFRDFASPGATTNRNSLQWMSSPSNVIERAYPGESKPKRRRHRSLGIQSLRLRGLCSRVRGRQLRG
jgi:hypothetical protein